MVYTAHRSVRLEYFFPKKAHKSHGLCSVALISQHKRSTKSRHFMSAWAKLANWTPFSFTIYCPWFLYSARELIILRQECFHTSLPDCCMIAIECSNTIWHTENKNTAHARAQYCIPYCTLYHRICIPTRNLCYNRKKAYTRFPKYLHICELYATLINPISFQLQSLQHTRTWQICTRLAV